MSLILSTGVLFLLMCASLFVFLSSLSVQGSPDALTSLSSSSEPTLFFKADFITFVNWVSTLVSESFVLSPRSIEYVMCFCETILAKALLSGILSFFCKLSCNALLTRAWLVCVYLMLPISVVAFVTSSCVVLPAYSHMPFVIARHSFHGCMLCDPSNWATDSHCVVRCVVPARGPGARPCLSYPTTTVLPAPSCRWRCLSPLSFENASVRLHVSAIRVVMPCPLLAMISPVILSSAPMGCCSIVLNDAMSLAASSQMYTLHKFITYALSCHASVGPGFSQAGAACGT